MRLQVTKELHDATKADLHFAVWAARSASVTDLTKDAHSTKESLPTEDVRFMVEANSTKKLYSTDKAHLTKEARMTEDVHTTEYSVHLTKVSVHLI